MARSASHQSVIVCQGGYNRRSVWSRRVVRVAVAGDRAGGMHGESLLLTFPRAVLGGNFSQFQERGATNVGNLRATSDTEMRKIGPSPAGCDENRAIRSLSSSAVGPPQPSAPASSGAIFSRNAARAKVNNRL